MWLHSTLVHSFLDTTSWPAIIHWLMNSISFRPQLLDPSSLHLTSSARAAQLPPNPTSDHNPKPSESVPRISLIGAAAFLHASKQPGTQCLRIHLSDPRRSTKSASVETLDLSQIPKEYHDYADVFSTTNLYFDYTTSFRETDKIKLAHRNLKDAS